MLNKYCCINSLPILPQTEEAGDEGATILESQAENQQRLRNKNGSSIGSRARHLDLESTLHL